MDINNDHEEELEETSAPDAQSNYGLNNPLLVPDDYGFVSEEVMQSEIMQEMSTVGDMLRYLTTAIAKSGVFCGHGSESPYQEAGQLLSFVLGLDYEDLDDFEHSAITTRERREVFDVLMVRLFDRVPTPYITNLSYYGGLKFYVDENVIIPRSPMAQLIKNGLDEYLPEESSLVLDLCTGSGCLAILMAHDLGIQVDAVDISPEALEICHHNVMLNGVDDLVTPILSDLFEEIPEEAKYDLIMTNPPYVDAYEMENMPEEFQCEPSLALAGGEDGLDVVRRILREVADHLTTDGYLICEVGNSMDALIDAYPDVPFTWLDFEEGDSGVFVLSYQELVNAKEFFKEK